MPRKVTTTTLRTEIRRYSEPAAYAGERVILHRHNKPVAAVVPMEDLEMLEQI